MISGMIVWAVWFVVVYGLTGVGCRGGWQQIRLPLGDALTLAMLASTLIALLLIGVAAWRGYVAWRLAAQAGSVHGAERGGRQRFLGLVTLLVSALAALGTVMIALPIFMLDPCAA